MEVAETSNARRRQLFTWRNPFSTIQHLQNVSQQRIQLCKVIDSYDFDWKVWAVAASGFFTDSYNLFATNVILPALAFVYWPERTVTTRESTINLVTLAATIFGMLVFGFLADKYGRQKLYGVELILVIISTLGLAQSSYGVQRPDLSGSSMSVLGWIIFWRIVMGAGIGAEYPLSATITAEWASVNSRARMLAAVFIMQPLGQLAAYTVGLVVLAVLKKYHQIDNITDHAAAAPIIDVFWRWVTGIGAVPALIALIFRLKIPESGRWRVDVRGEADRAMYETHAHYGMLSTLSLADDLEIEEEDTRSNMSSPRPSMPQEISIKYFRQYLISNGHWRYLAGTSICWFMLDFAYYGLQINNPRVLAKLWASKPPVLPVNAIPTWLPDPIYWNTTTAEPTTTIYHVLLRNSWHAVISVSAGSVVGSLILIKIINYISRRNFLIWTFFGLAVLTAGTGVSFLHTFQTPLYGITISLFVLCQLFFNLGPNTLTFIIPAEIFPTPIRCTCHGIAAAAGKLSSVIVQASLPYMRFGGHQIRDLDSQGMGWVLIIFSVTLALGGFFAWAWLPHVQYPERVTGTWILPSISLEDLAQGRSESEVDGQCTGIRKRMAIKSARG